jgi:hypothetical protein
MFRIRQFLFVAGVIFVSLVMVQCQESPSLASIQILPDNAALTYAGQSLQYKALGTYLHLQHPIVTKDITNQVIWQSTNPGAATISSTGLATAVAAGTTQSTTIMASTTASLRPNKDRQHAQDSPRQRADRGHTSSALTNEQSARL